MSREGMESVQLVLVAQFRYMTYHGRCKKNLDHVGSSCMGAKSRGGKNNLIMPFSLVRNLMHLK